MASYLELGASQAREHPCGLLEGGGAPVFKPSLVRVGDALVGSLQQMNVEAAAVQTVQLKRGKGYGG
eukprot:scaffold2214_cov128-Isochrysis_galbana.AAC.11